MIAGAVAVVPAFGDNPARQQALARVEKHLRGRIRVYRIRSSVASAGAARNLGATLADDDSVLVFNDGDTICPLEQIQQAVTLAGDRAGLVYAYTLYLRVGEYGRVPFGPFEAEYVNPPSMGCVAISRESFETVGGFDEAYVGWGYEDVDFAQRCTTRWPTRRVEGPCFHLWHGARNPDDSPADADPALVAANLDRFHVKTAA